MKGTNKLIGVLAICLLTGCANKTELVTEIQNETLPTEIIITEDVNVKSLEIKPLSTVDDNEIVNEEISNVIEQEENLVDETEEETKEEKPVKRSGGGGGGGGGSPSPKKEEPAKTSETTEVFAEDSKNLQAEEYVEKELIEDVQETEEEIIEETPIIEVEEKKSEEDQVLEIPFFTELSKEESIPEEEQEMNEDTNTETETETVVELTELQLYDLAAADQGIKIAQYYYARATNDLDKDMLRYPYSTSNEYAEIKSFTLELIDGCETEEDKTKTIYEYIVNNIEYDLTYQAATTYQTFTDKKGVCSQLATLMHDMLSAANIVSFYVSGLYNAQSLDIDESINYYYYPLLSRHGWLIIMVDNEWRYCDPTMGNYKMYTEDMVDKLYSTRTVDSISTLPEKESVELLDVVEVETEAPSLVLKDGIIKAYRNGEAMGNYNYMMPFTSSFFIEKQEVEDIVYTMHGYGLTDNSVWCNNTLVSSTLVYYATTRITDEEGNNVKYIWTDPILYNYAKENKMTRRLDIFTSTDRKLDGVDVISYWVDEYGVDKTNDILNQTVFSVDENNLYINHEDVDMYLTNLL